ncbi:MFS-type transporter SLC18B1-like [Sycon ciliatum]|uniref:MFS-type transporter SLC18B1-like n=1 Tax=Sycon ciliatum TaxID=27933 RepID=UPI0031F63501
MICLSVMIPFFPTEAAQKDPHPNSVEGLSAIGFVFSITAFMQFLTALVIGKILPHSGPKIIIILGGMLISGSIALFGFVNRIDDWPQFLGICYALRAVQGVGTAFELTASFALLFGIFPASISLVSGLFHGFNGLGFAIGPALSGSIYDQHGFLLPFIIYGGIMAASTAAVMVLLPGDIEIEADRKSKDIFMAALKLPVSALWLATALVAGAAGGLLEPGISPYLRDEFGISPSHVGLIYLLHSGVFIITAPLTGYIGDRYVKPKHLVIIGSFLHGGALVLLGPVKTAGVLSPALWRSTLSMAIVGGGLGVTQTCLVPGMLNALYKAGFTDSVELHGTAAGMITGFFSLGIGIGPLVGSALTGAVGFPDAAAMFALVLIANGFAFIAFSVYECIRAFVRKSGSCNTNADTPSETTPLIRDNQDSTGV